MPLQLLTYAGWPHCIRLFNREVELIATTDVGPRIIRFAFIGGPNEFVEYPEQSGLRGGSEYRSYGGHRLWAAPEVRGWTNHPENEQVEYRQDGETLVLKAAVETGTKLQKEIRIRLDPQENHVQVTHRLTNHSSSVLKVAPWALSVMAPGGRAIIPHEPYQAHSERVLPVRPLVFWAYTQMTDTRWTWGNRFIRLRQDRNATTPQKIGAMISEGWAAYANEDRLFIKRFPFDPAATYPDFGCNAEFFTNARMLEIESLGPLTSLVPGESIAHEEQWYLFRNVKIGDIDEEISSQLGKLVKATSSK